MSLIPTELIPYLTYATPPLLGGFIGYLTNRVAIRMLFRPLKQWKIGPLPIPMTPGVIPSKRHDLAENIGEMVGEHLLTSDEINNALKKETFQEHLYYLIESKVGSFMKKDLGPLSSVIHPAYRNYFEIGYRTVTYQIKETVHHYLSSEACRDVIEKAVEGWTSSLFSREINSAVPEDYRQGLYAFFNENVEKMFDHPDMDELIHSFFAAEAANLVKSPKSLEDITPDAIRQQIIKSIGNQTPLLLHKAAQIISEPAMREKIIAVIKQAIEEFVASMGPMAGLINGFLKNELIDEKIRFYLGKKENDIISFLSSKTLQHQVAAVLVERAETIFRTPLIELAGNVENDRMLTITAQLSRQIADTIREKRVARSLSTMFQNNIERFIENGTRSIQPVVLEVAGKRGLDTFNKWLKREVISLLVSRKNRQVIDYMIEQLLDSLVKKPIGRLDHIIPVGVREGLYRSLQEMAMKMLTSEIPGVVKSINIRKIVTEKIDSFDLLRLEQLLLSIMEEQFKYINLFGGLLGFLIGCANLFIIIGLQ